jgi:hypothetical protein
MVLDPRVPRKTMYNPPETELIAREKASEVLSTILFLSDIASGYRFAYQNRQRSTPSFPSSHPRIFNTPRAGARVSEARRVDPVGVTAVRHGPSETFL